MSTQMGEVAPPFENWGFPVVQERNDFLVNVSPKNFWVPTETSDFQQQSWIPEAAPGFLPYPWWAHVYPNDIPPPIPKVLILKMVAESCYIPKDDDRNPRGDDAHFLCLENQTIGVADGVGGWIKKGIDAGKYARDIMENSRIAAQFEPKGAVNPKKVMQQAYLKTKAEGSSTACIITLLSDNVLRAANVGDSGFILIRGGKVVYRSAVQQRSFNCPYQLGNTKDDPSIAQELEVAVEEGDMVVAATDGLFDNMHESEILEIIESRTSKGADPKEVASALVNIALYNSFNRFDDTPYSIESRKAGHNHKGGKVDDITAIVACIQSSN